MNSAVLHPQPETAPEILRLDDVRVRFPVSNDWLGRPRGYAHALNGIDLQVRAGETLGVVGESGCGKSTLAQLLMGLIAPSSGALNWSERGSGQPGSNVQIVFQDPQSSLDPRLPIWRIITEPLYARGHASREQMRAVAAKVASQVGIRPEYLDRFPHQFSGGQRQRIAIARALSSDPDIIVLDEPTSALDISVQAQILNLLAELQRARKLTYILISHNVSVVRHMADRVAVMYLGQIVELGSAAHGTGPAAASVHSPAAGSGAAPRACLYRPTRSRHPPNCRATGACRRGVSFASAARCVRSAVKSPRSWWGLSSSGSGVISSARTRVGQGQSLPLLQAGAS